MRRNTARRDRHRRIIAKDEPPCALCGDPINYQAHHLDPLAFTIDHITPMSRGGDELDTLDNLQAAHRECNRDKSNHVAIGVSFVTERSW